MSGYQIRSLPLVRRSVETASPRSNSRTPSISSGSGETAYDRDDRGMDLPSSYYEAETPANMWPSTPSPRNREVMDDKHLNFCVPAGNSRTKLNGQARAFVPSQNTYMAPVAIVCGVSADGGAMQAMVPCPWANDVTMGQQTPREDTRFVTQGAVVDTPKKDYKAQSPPVKSVGSDLHGTGKCKPCAWVWKSAGCENGTDCAYCHLCPADELKNRKRAKLAVMRGKA
eukprot:gb/GFBE01072915.1/.p1 GENE.gb/GFBE01072915.1/~~gb/GFBE01072915.1/.p1  ORF type:complete len:227 (+),score=28.95 gb/GFBE01072915.1/:1-681(+)